MTEHDLIQGCLRGDARCQRALVDRYVPVLLTAARRYAGDHSAAEDILQEALIKIFRALPRYRATGSFEGWMRRIVANTALNALDKSRLRLNNGCLSLVDDPEIPPEAYVHLGTEELLALIARLPEGFRQIFNLYVMEQYPHTEIAAMLGISESTSRSQLMRARRLLQNMIAQREKIRI
ncbi:MAG: RNA polymerase sigma factor [Saprospiraceae bacterium]|nr:RNA polymerase sigma factor [Saprospiraceae bacterium]